MSKVRVHELAKELGVESKVVLAKLQELGEFVKSASSTVEAPVVRKLKEAMPAAAPSDAPAAKAVAKKTAKKTTAKKTAASADGDDIDLSAAQMPAVAALAVEPPLATPPAPLPAVAVSEEAPAIPAGRPVGPQPGAPRFLAR